MRSLADAPPFPFLRCEKCREHLDEGDLFCPGCGHEAPHPGNDPKHEPDRRVEVNRFECTGCGASLTWELEAQGLCCAFCGRAELEERETVHMPPPRWVIPFQSRDKMVPAFSSTCPRSKATSLAMTDSGVSFSPIRSRAFRITPLTPL